MTDVSVHARGARRSWTAAWTGAAAVLALAGLVAAERADLASAAWTALAVALFAAWQTARALRAVREEEAARRNARAEAPRSDTPPYETIFELHPDPALVVTAGDPDDLASRRIAASNAAARELLRIPTEGALLLTVLRHPEVLEAVDESLFGGLTSTAVWEGGGAQERVWRAWSTPAPLAGGGRAALLVIHEETDVRRAERTRADFMANASHELRTPLASLSGFIETLRGHAKDDPDARDRFLSIMGDQAERMARLVDDLLSLSRIELNEHVPPSGRVDLSLAVVDVCDALALLARERRVTLKSQPLPRGEAVITGDRDQMVQVVQNLVDNALKYSPDEAEVLIEIGADLPMEEILASRTPGAARLSLLTPDRDPDQLFACLRVSDLGPGIAREHLPRLSERFYRVEGQKSGERPGTGLGLAIVKHVVNRHRGGMVVESLQGAGTTFTVYIPMAEARAVAETKVS